LEKLSTSELRELSTRIEVEIKARKRRRKVGLKPAVASKGSAASRRKTASRANGAGRTSKKSRVLYRNPADPSLTWSGRGRKPKWLAKAANIEKYRVR
jgi:DNA-binding protein H-NS